MSRNICIIGFLVVICAALPFSWATLCWLDVHEDFSHEHPLILKNGVNEFVYPDRDDDPSILELEVFELLRVACPGDDLIIDGQNIKRNETTITCYGLTFMDVTGSDEDAEFNDIRCARPPVAIARRRPQPCPSGKLSQIGFQLKNFLPTIDKICFNETIASTLWAHSKIPNIIESRQAENTSLLTNPNLGDYYQNIRMEGLFQKDYQKTLLTMTINDLNTVEKYIPTSGANYLVEAQLVPSSSMFYTSQQSSTNFQINTIPVWKSIVEGNLNLVQEEILKIAADEKRSEFLEVWSGVIDVLKINGKDIYLTKDLQGKNAIPVPKIIYKYIFDEVLNEGIVFLILNDAHEQKIQTLCEEYEKCPTLYPQFKNFSLGYTYCCTVNESSKFMSIAMNLGLPIFPTANPIL